MVVVEEEEKDRIVIEEERAGDHALRKEATSRGSGLGPGSLLPGGRSADLRGHIILNID